MGLVTLLALFALGLENARRSRQRKLAISVGNIAQV
jgi:hypothetical protein